MNIYYVYTDSKRQDSQLVLIKQGLSYAASIFNIFWTIYHKMWS